MISFRAYKKNCISIPLRVWFYSNVYSWTEKNQSFRILLADLEKEERSQIKTGDKVFCLCSVIFLQLLVTVAIRVACLDFDDKQQLIRLLVYIQSDIIVKFVHTVPCLRKLQSKYLLISAFCCSDFVHFVALRLPHHLLLDSPLSPKKNITNCSPSEDYNTLWIQYLLKTWHLTISW